MQETHKAIAGVIYSVKDAEFTVYEAMYFLPWLDSPTGLRPSACWPFEITLRHTTLGRVPLDGRSL
jgi:hypothetical protein